MAQVFVNFTFTVPDGYSEYWFILTIDGKFVAKVKGSDVQFFNTILLTADAVHRYEVKCVNPQRFSSRSGPSSIAASGPFFVDTQHTEFIVGATTPSALDHAIQYILNVINLVENTAAYTLQLESSDSYDAWVIATFCDEAASSSSANFSNGAYKNFTIDTSGTWDDVYPLGSNIHIEGTPLKNGIQAGSKQVIDLIAGQPPTPAPTSVNINTGFLNGVLCLAANPPSNGEAILDYIGDPVGGDTTIQFENGIKLIVPHAEVVGGEAVLTSGPAFDYLMGLQGIDAVKYLILDSTGTIFQLGSSPFTPQ